MTTPPPVGPAPTILAGIGLVVILLIVVWTLVEPFTR